MTTYNPVSTYRIQFNQSFTLQDLNRSLEYLSLLGPGSIYASPLFAAVPGSAHGYDSTDPECLNPEVGDLPACRKLSAALKSRKIGWIQDVVPNHMACHPENRWLRDVLEKARDSVFFPAFDFEPAVRRGMEKLRMPLLGDSVERVLQQGELKLQLDRHGSFGLAYFKQVYPINFSSFRNLVKGHLQEAPGEWQKLWRKYGLDRSRVDRSFLNGPWEAAKKELARLYGQAGSRAFVEQLLDSANRHSERLAELLAGQHYQLCDWREAAKQINYRRFFTVASLICLRMEDPRVMQMHHRLLFEMLADNLVQGLRLDHVDGLRDPAAYLRRLRGLIGEDKYVAVEKILGRHERLSPVWPVQGSTGYDFLALTTNLLAGPQNHLRLMRFYRRITGVGDQPEEVVYRNRRMILTGHMRGELDNLCQRFARLLTRGKEKGLVGQAEAERTSPAEWQAALAEFMLACPVYRLYPEQFPLVAGDRLAVAGMLATALARKPHLKRPLKVVGKLVLAKKMPDQKFATRLEDFFARCMQYLGPLAAKGVEDTSMYQHHALPAHNEVGDEVASPGISVAAFHEGMRERRQRWPLTMNCTSTHDTKRGEDARARLLAATEVAEQWQAAVGQWFKLNHDLRSRDEHGESMPAASDEYLIYQTIVATFPFDEVVDQAYVKRIQDYLVKALREGKQNSQWEAPNQEYERAVIDFVAAALRPEHRFLKSFIPFHRGWQGAAVRKSLVQLALKCLAPGLPDIYRGTEVWDLSLVDPDNRRPVDFDLLHRHLQSTMRQWRKNPAATMRELQENLPDGRLKQWVTCRLLHERKNSPNLFLHGEYLPLSFAGRHRDHVFGFARRLGDDWLICVLPLRAGGLPVAVSRGHGALSAVDWGDTGLTLPVEAPEQWRELFANRHFVIREEIAVATLFEDFPIAVLRGQKKPSPRRAGVLMHITSLPGEHGLGDLGESAFRFVDFLVRSRQTCWQILPLTPVSRAAAWSPYNCPSAFAGNPLLISMQKLYCQGLLGAADLATIKAHESNRVDYAKAARHFRPLLFRAWQRMRTGAHPVLAGEFEDYCRREEAWLDDYSLFVAGQLSWPGRTWQQWPEPLKNREAMAMRQMREGCAEIVEVEKFCQFIFDRQWRALKEYANAGGIQMFGDMPFYVSYDSADVWANQGLFKLQRNGRMAAVAGVPPDYFDSRGQLWNMPVFNWWKNRDPVYQWWLRRIARNLSLFDLLRLDHFRAFSAFWQVPAKERTAVAGTWRRGPGESFFLALREHFPKMPLVAEDLGDIDQPVYDLRNQFELPGMQVLQFGFDRKMAGNLHAPHNYRFNSVVFTGTHDNNTVRGWFAGELDAAGKERLRDYTGASVNSDNVHWRLIRMALASPAKLAIIPIQDYLGLGAEARMNKPSTGSGNWSWKSTAADLTPELAEAIKKLTLMFNRG